MCGMDLVAVDTERASHFTCPMHPSVRQTDEGVCPMCGMDLVAVTEENRADTGVYVSETRRSQIGVRTEPAAVRPLHIAVRAVGEIVYDETRMHDVSLKVEGWVEELDVDRTAQGVEKGERLLSLYSPDLYSAQRELLQVRESGNQALVETAESRLLLWGMARQTIDEVVRRGEPLLNVPIVSPAAGYVVEKSVVEGSYVPAGGRLFRVAGLERVWVEASVFETDIALLNPGARVSVTVGSLPGVERHGVVDFVYPHLASETRTGRVRIELDNTDGELKPGMYADVSIHADLGDALQIPESAVIFTGPHRLVFVEGPGEHLVPREVNIGRRSDGRYQVLDGIEVGERVVTKGGFMIASESRIRAALDYWEGESDGRHDH
jgi:Cu(I)/Ag(I) efflux system membrane fusion protein